MNLQSERLLLKEVTWEFLPFMHEKNREPAVAEYNTIGIPDSVEITRELIRHAVEEIGCTPRKQYCWAVFISETNEFIGEIGLSNSADRFKLGEIHYSFLSTFWGHGYGFEGVKTAMKFGFDDVGLHRIQAGVAIENERSIKLLEKLGMQREGRKRKILPMRGNWRDNYQYAIIEDDPRSY